MTSFIFQNRCQFQSCGRSVTPQFVTFYRSGEEWHKIRTLLNKRMLKPAMCQQYAGQLSGIASELTDNLRSVRDRDPTDKTIPDILNLLYAWSIESKSRDI